MSLKLTAPQGNRSTYAGDWPGVWCQLPWGIETLPWHLRSEPLAVCSSSVLTQDLTRFQMQIKKPWDISTKDH